jgi:hypothetical protein
MPTKSNTKMLLTHCTDYGTRVENITPLWMVAKTFLTPFLPSLSEKYFLNNL